MMNLDDLKKPFPASDIEWRVQAAGQKDGKVWSRVLAYVTNRAIQNRLDEVVGPANWKNEFKEWPGKGVLCGISIKIDNEWITKWDGAEETNIEATKGGLSGAMKRAAVQWGIGRYLYDLEAGYAKIHDKGKHFQSGKKDEYPAFKWDEPDLPAWALPAGEAKKQPAPATQPKAETPAEPAKEERPPQVDENGEVKMVQPGEQLKPGHWFWNLKPEEKKQHMPEGYWYSKIDGVWTCTKKAA